MKEIAEKLRNLEQTLAAERGAFQLFALFLREDAPDVWDLVVAADWIDVDQVSALEELSARVQKCLKLKELLRIAGIIVVSVSNPALQAVAATISGEHLLFEVKDSQFFGQTIKHAYIITSKLRPAA